MVRKNPEVPNVVFENVRILFRNFTGKEGTYNVRGDRNFCIALTDEVAEDMKANGWNIKYLKPREEGDAPLAYIPVRVNFGGRPPRVVMVTSRGKTTLGEDEVAILDWADIENVDVIIRASHWEVNGKTGIKAYAQSVYVTIIEDDLERKYVDVPDSAVSSMISDERAVIDDGPPWGE